MKPARVVHFGGDECRRVELLEDAGYTVDDCGSISALVSALSTGAEPELVLVSESRSELSASELLSIRECSAVPVVLFQSTRCHCDESQFDAVIPALTPPDQWLEKVDSLLRASRLLQANSRLLRCQSELLRRESSVVRGQTSRERSRLRAARTRDPLEPGTPDD